MKLWKFTICSIFMVCIFLSCGSKSNMKEYDSIYLCYDKKYNILSIRNIESVRIVKKIEFDLQEDTLFINKISKKSILFPNKLTPRETAVCTIKLRPNVKFVKLGDTLFNLSEINEFSIEEFIEKYFGAIILVYPDKFPYVIE